MTQCEECSSAIDAYLHGDLSAEEKEVFEGRLQICPDCAAELKRRRIFVNELRAQWNQTKVPAELRAKIEAAMGGKPERKPGTPGILWVKTWLFPALTSAALALGIVVLWVFSQQEARANAFIETAVKTHKAETTGQLPSDVTTSSPSDISRWFSARVPFRFRLPDYQNQTGAKFQIVGGRLVQFRNEPAAYIAYRMGSRLVSLLITSSKSSTASGGEVTKANDLVFSFAHPAGFASSHLVCTWGDLRIGFKRSCTREGILQSLPSVIGKHC